MNVESLKSIEYILYTLEKVTREMMLLFETYISNKGNQLKKTERS